MITVGVAGAFLAMRATFDAYAGAPQLLFAFEAAVIGGAGSVWGTLIGGIVLGLAQALGAQVGPQGFLIGGHAVFLAVLFARLFVPEVSPSPPVSARSSGGRHDDFQAGHARRALDVRIAPRHRCGVDRGGGPGAGANVPRGRRRRPADDVVHLRHARGDVERACGVWRARFGRPAGVLRARRLSRYPSRRCRHQSVPVAADIRPHRRSHLAAVVGADAAPPRRRVRHRHVGDLRARTCWSTSTPWCRARREPR